MTPAQIKKLKIENEKKIAAKAAKMLQDAVNTRIDHLDLNFGKTGNQSMRNTKVFSNFDLKSDDKYFNRLSLDMEKHGFVHHYGIMQGAVRKYPNGKKSILGKPFPVRTHFYKNSTKEQGFITDAIAASNAVKYICDELAKERAREVFLNMKSFFNK